MDLKDQKDKDRDQNIYISTKEHQVISSELNRNPSLTLEKIENMIRDNLTDIANEEKKYLSDLDNKQYQKTLIERKGMTDSNNSFLKVFQYLDDEIKALIAEHNDKSDKLRADLLYAQKMRKVYFDIHPISPRDRMDKEENKDDLLASPRLTKLVKSNSFLRRSLDLIKK